MDSTKDGVLVHSSSESSYMVDVKDKQGNVGRNKRGDA